MSVLGVSPILRPAKNPSWKACEMEVGVEEKIEERERREGSVASLT